MNLPCIRVGGSPTRLYLDLLILPSFCGLLLLGWKGADTDTDEFLLSPWCLQIHHLSSNSTHLELEVRYK